MDQYEIENMYKPVPPSHTGLTTPAIIAGVAYIVVALTIILPFKIPLQDNNGDIYILPYNLIQRLLVLVMLTIPTILSVYSLNCMMVGHCDILSSVVSGLTVLWAIMFVVVAYMYTLIDLTDGRYR